MPSGSSRETREAFRRRIRRTLRPTWLGSLRRTTPISTECGYDRGRPVDRYYIERFIQSNRADLRGRVLEVKEPLYTERYGDGATAIDVLDKDGGNPRATIVADLAGMPGVASHTFDCCVITQTLQYLFDVGAAIRELHRTLKPGGILLVTVPGICRVCPVKVAPDYWRFTASSCERLFGDVFGERQVTVESHGNVLASVAFLEGLAQEELTHAELDVNDPLYPIVVTVRAVKELAA
jgi:SAM-dependent methyltransferase